MCVIKNLACATGKQFLETFAQRYWRLVAAIKLAIKEIALPVGSVSGKAVADMPVKITAEELTELVRLGFISFLSNQRLTEQFDKLYQLKLESGKGRDNPFKSEQGVDAHDLVKQCFAFHQFLSTTFPHPELCR